MSDPETLKLLNFRNHREAEKEARAWRAGGHSARVEMDTSTSRWSVIVTYVRKPADG